MNQVIRGRRSVFTDQFEKGKRVPDEEILELLENANWAPNHKQTEPWRFIVYTGDGLQRFADFQAMRYKETAGAGFKAAKFEKQLTAPLAASHIIAMVMKRSEASVIPEMEEIAAVACAVENIYLSLAAYGLGGYWSTGGVTYDPAARSFFGLEDGDLLMGFFYIGYVRVPSVGGRRRPVAEKTSWVRE